MELLLDFLPKWHYHVARPFKRLLDDGISPEIYYTVQMLRRRGGTVTMSELGKRAKMPKQQVTKIVNRLIEYELAERVYDSEDRRFVKIRITRKADEYAKHFPKEADKYFTELFEKMEKSDAAEFIGALRTMNTIFEKIPPEAESAVREKGERPNA